MTHCSQQLLLSQNSSNCFVCNGYYGPCFDDPTCATCHAFLYPNSGQDCHCLTIVPDVSDDSDSDSGNDEPVDNTFLHDKADHIHRFIPSLAVQLEKLSVPNQADGFAIEGVPPECKKKMFTSTRNWVQLQQSFRAEAGKLQKKWDVDISTYYLKHYI